MEDLVQQSIALVQSKARSNWPWNFDEPWDQPSYLFSAESGEWKRNGDDTRTKTDSGNFSKLALYTWNVDFMLPFPNSRMSAAIRHLQTLVQSQPADLVTVCYLQECVLSDLDFLSSDDWVRGNFAMTDIGIENWQSGHYGTVTLVDRRLQISRCFRTHFSATKMERDVLVTDLRFSPLTSSDKGDEHRLIRLCNLHLESLAMEPPMRPPQMQLTAQHMHEPSIDGAAVAGDFNAIQRFDRHLHSDNNLKDAYLELGGSENDAEGGHTWGQQAATKTVERFGTSRMDKVFFCGVLKCSSFERFGAGVEVADEAEREAIVRLGFKRPWITDHLGVKAVFEVQ